MELLSKVGGCGGPLPHSGWEEVRMNVTMGTIQDLPVRTRFVLQGGQLLSPDAEAERALRLSERCEAFDGGPGEIGCVWDYGSGSAQVFVGLGTQKGCEAVRRAAAKLIEWAELRRIPVLGLYTGGLEKAHQRAAAEGAVMAGYRYDEYLTRKSPSGVERLVLEEGASEAGTAVAEGAVLGNCVNIARDLVNEPSNVQTPQRLAQEAQALGRRFGFAVQCLEEELQELGMEALCQVGKGSPNRPVLIVMRHMGDPDHPKEITGLIGKGVTYDSGGLNLKSGQRFVTMKHDMAGAATVIGAMCAIAQQKLPVNVTAVVAACENLVSAQAYRSGDIIGSMADRTIQINSTDAEGRLTLIDAMTYAIRREGVVRLVDIGTLTGAARRVLGEYGAPVLGNDNTLWSALEEAAGRSDELICRIPLVPDAQSKLRGDVSDLVNTTLEQTGGMVSAALFLEEFAEERAWLHIDAAGPLWLDRPMPYTPKGGSGWGVRTLYHLAKQLPNFR